MKNCRFPVVRFIVLQLVKYNLCGLNNKCFKYNFPKNNSHYVCNKTKN